MKIKSFLSEKLLAFLLLPFAFLAVKAQEQPPAPQAPKSVKIPAVKEKKLANGLTVAVVERKGVPVVTVQLMVKSGAGNEPEDKAGLANMTASLLTKGTKTRTATQIAEQIEFLGGEINSGAGWNNSLVGISVMSSKLDQAMAVMADVVLNPTFKQEEIDLLKSQTLDGLTFNLKQPGFLANYVASKYSFGEHPAGGTPESLNSISQTDISDFHKKNYLPANSVLIFTGDIAQAKANALAQKYLGSWKQPAADKPAFGLRTKSGSKSEPLFKRLLVVDLPNSGQASVSYLKRVGSGRIMCGEPEKCISDNYFYTANVLNSVLGGGYSSRLNQEIRIKRGLSYGAGSSFGWRSWTGNFGTRTQTKNESAAEVAQLVLAEVEKLTVDNIPNTELVPRKSVLTGNFGRNLETTEGLAQAVADLYSFNISPNELNMYMKSVQSVNDSQITEFAQSYLRGGDVIIVGDYAKFKDDLAKRFPSMKIEVVKADGLDLSKLD